MVPRKQFRETAELMELLSSALCTEFILLDLLQFLSSLLKIAK